MHIVHRLRASTPLAILVAVMATLLVSGGAFATASKLITGKQIRNHSITGVDVKNRSLGAKAFKKGVLKRGKVGPAGAAGANGRDGAAGAQGERGPAGETGATGAAGARGAQGEKGDAGEQGDAGQKGDKGESGAPGRDGVDGKDGAPGQNGAAGANGAPGLSAYQLWLLGPDGVAGTDDDNHGTVGDFMKSLHGADGATGPQGPKGEPGIPSAVATKICTVPMTSGNGRKLGLGAICDGQADAQTVYIPQS